MKPDEQLLKKMLRIGDKSPRTLEIIATTVARCVDKIADVVLLFYACYLVNQLLNKLF